MVKFIFISELIITMPIKAAMWVHGNVVEAQNPEPSLKVSRYDWGTVFKETSEDGLDRWFHIPIPTPVILDGVKPTLNKIFIFYKTEGWEKVFLTKFNLRDGAFKVGGKTFASDDSSKSGEHYSKIEMGFNSWNIIPPITLSWGLGISVKVHFQKLGASVPDDTNHRRITFYTAGADFITP